MSLTSLHLHEADVVTLQEHSSKVHPSLTETILICSLSQAQIFVTVSQAFKRPELILTSGSVRKRSYREIVSGPTCFELDGNVLPKILQHVWKATLAM